MRDARFIGDPGCNSTPGWHLQLFSYILSRVPRTDTADTSPSPRRSVLSISAEWSDLKRGGRSASRGVHRKIGRFPLRRKHTLEPSPLITIISIAKDSSCLSEKIGNEILQFQRKVKSHLALYSSTPGYNTFLSYGSNSNF